MSTALNTMSAVFVEDWIRGCNLANPTENQASWIMKAVVVVMGVFTVALIYVIGKLGMVFQVGHIYTSTYKCCHFNSLNCSQMAGTLVSISIGPSLTIFLIGLFMPWVTGTVSTKNYIELRG